jgi:hypothetical protein
VEPTKEPDFGTLDDLQAKIARAQAEWLRLYLLLTRGQA